MRRPAAILIPAAAALACLSFSSSCHPRSHMPSWVLAAPADSLAAFSGEAGWMLTHKEIQSYISRDPMVERALDLFLQKAHISPRLETGRVTFHVVGMPQKGEETLQKGLEHILIQLTQFKDPAALVGALAESFPQEGSLRIQGRDWPLYVILDIDTGGTKAHIRAARSGSVPWRLWRTWPPGMASAPCPMRRWRRNGSVLGPPSRAISSPRRCSVA